MSRSCPFGDRQTGSLRPRVRASLRARTPPVRALRPDQPSRLCLTHLHCLSRGLQALEAFWEDPDAFEPPAPKSNAADIEALYTKYKEEDEDAIGVDGACAFSALLLSMNAMTQVEPDHSMGPTGLIAFCTDLDVDPTDVRMLVFCYSLQVEILRPWKLPCPSSTPLPECSPSPRR